VQINETKTVTDLKKWMSMHKESIEGLAEEKVDKIRIACEERLKSLQDAPTRRARRRELRREQGCRTSAYNERFDGHHRGYPGISWIDGFWRTERLAIFFWTFLGGISLFLIIFVLTAWADR